MKQTISGAILLIIWIVFMVLYGNSKDYSADVSGGGAYEPSKVVGHPLWND